MTILHDRAAGMTLAQEFAAVDAAEAEWKTTNDRRAAHVIGCSECWDGAGECGEGIRRIEEDVAAWSRFHDARRDAGIIL